jgi:hypothetical protein
METAHVRENAVDTNWNPGRKCQFFRYDEGKFKDRLSFLILEKIVGLSWMVFTEPQH